jgi:hypothetical protein
VDVGTATAAAATMAYLRCLQLLRPPVQSLAYSVIHNTLHCACRFGDDAKDTLFATVHDLDAVFDTHEALEQQKPEDKRGTPFVVSIPAMFYVWHHGHTSGFDQRDGS